MQSIEYIISSVSIYPVSSVFQHICYLVSEQLLVHKKQGRYLPSVSVLVESKISLGLSGISTCWTKALKPVAMRYLMKDIARTQTIQNTKAVIPTEVFYPISYS